MYNAGGTHCETTFVPGKRYRIRLVNAALDSFFRFMIDDHTLTVVSTDFVPIVPYETTNVGLGVGQRYDVIVTAQRNLTEGASFWMRSVPVSGCSHNAAPADLKGIVRYASRNGTVPSSPTTPTSLAPSYDSANCTDEAASDIVPYLSLNAGGADYKETFQLSLADIGGYEKWYLNNSTFVSEWDSPSKLPSVSRCVLLCKAKLTYFFNFFFPPCSDPGSDQWKDGLQHDTTHRLPATSQQVDVLCHQQHPHNRPPHSFAWPRLLGPGAGQGRVRSRHSAQCAQYAPSGCCHAEFEFPSCDWIHHRQPRNLVASLSCKF